MLDKIKHKLFGFKKVAGLELVLLPDSKIVFNLVVLSLKKDAVFVEKKEKNIQSIDELSQWIAFDIPVSLSVSGKGVLHKKVSNTGIQNNEDLVAAALPNAKSSDFYFSKHENENLIFVSLVRKVMLNEWLDQFYQKNIAVIQVEVGPWALVNLFPLLNPGTSTLEFSTYAFSIKNDLLIDFKGIEKSKEMDFEIETEKISSNLLLSFSSALQLISAPDTASDIDAVSVYKEEFVNKRIFKVLGYSVLSFFLVLMFTNYIFYSINKDTNSELSAKTSMYAGLIKEVEGMEKEVREREYFLKSAGWLTTPKTSFYADQIAATIPASIKLNYLKINPLNEKFSKKEKKPVFHTDTIQINGACRHPTVLNPWMSALRSKEWVEKVSNQSYVHDNKTGTGIFEVEICLGNEN